MIEYTTDEAYKRGFEAGKEYALGVLKIMVESRDEAVTLEILQKVEEVLKCRRNATSD